MLGGAAAPVSAGPGRQMELGAAIDPSRGALPACVAPAWFELASQRCRVDVAGCDAGIDSCLGIFDFYPRKGGARDEYFRMVRADHSARSRCICGHDAHLGMEGDFRKRCDLERENLPSKIRIGIRIKLVARSDKETKEKE